mgnify:CR=1 FL=1
MSLQVDQVADLSKKGLGIREIANAVGCSPHQVHNLRHVAKREGHDFPSLARRMTDDVRAEILRLFDEGMTQREIANAVGFGQSRVWSVLDDARRTGRWRSMKSLSRVKRGSLTKAAAIADEAAQDWLASQIPEGATLAETLMEIALDVYFEQKEGEA